MTTIHQSSPIREQVYRRERVAFSKVWRGASMQNENPRDPWHDSRHRAILLLRLRTFFEQVRAWVN